jgi:hypothetical protein
MDNQASSFEIRRIHHGSGGLFIGAHKYLFALMNAVPTKTLLLFFMQRFSHFS